MSEKNFDDTGRHRIKKWPLYMHTPSRECFIGRARNLHYRYTRAVQCWTPRVPSAHSVQLIEKRY